MHVEQLMTPEKFAEYLCADLSLPYNVYGNQISLSIKTQIKEHRQYYMTSDVPMPLDSRIPIVLDIHVGKLNLRDRFEWDLSSQLEPEEFARILANEMGLASEFISLISHSIREQILKSKQERDLIHAFALESRFRGEEEARSWCPSIELLAEGDDKQELGSRRDR